MALARVWVYWCLLVLTGTLIVESGAQSCSVPNWFLQPSGGNVVSYTWDGITPFSEQFGSPVFLFNAFGMTTTGFGSIVLEDSVDLIRIGLSGPQDLEFYPAFVKSSPREVNPSYPVEIYVDVVNSPGFLSGYESLLYDVMMIFNSAPPITLKGVIVLTYRCLTRSGTPRTSTYQFILLFGLGEIVGIVNFAEVDILPTSETFVNTNTAPYDVINPAFADDESYVLGQTNFKNPGQWMFLLVPSFNLPIVPPALEGITSWTPWKCLACGGCGTRERTFQGRAEYDYGACGKPKVCIRGRHSRREKSVRSLRNPRRRVTRSRRCCYDYRRKSKPESRPRYCKALGGWQNMMNNYP